MRLVLMSVAFLGAALCAGQPSWAQQFGLDSGLKALETADATRGWEAVGRIDIGDHAFCTGTLIAPDIVLTAAHCLYDKESLQKSPAEAYTFRAGLRNGRAIATRGVVRVVAHPKYVYRGPDNIDATPYDLAFLQLDMPIPLATIRPFATGGDPTEGDRVEVVSYAVDRSEAPSLQQACHTLPSAMGIDVFSCSVDFGSSGAPILKTIGTTPEIVSVVSAKAVLDGRSVSLGAQMAGPLVELRAEYARQVAGGGAVATTATLPPAAVAPVMVQAATPGTLPQIGTANSGGAKFVKP